MPPIDQRYYYEDRDRHGNLRRYFRQRVKGSKKVRKIRLREEPGTAEFHEEFAAAMAGRAYVRKDAPKVPAPPPRVVEKSLRWLINKYYRESLEFRAYDEETKKNRRRILERLCEEPVAEGSQDEIGDLACDIPKDKIELLVKRKAATSIDAANHRPKAIRKLSEWAVAQTPPLMNANLAKDVELLKRVDTGGHHTWTLEEIDEFIKVHPIGTKAHLALALFLFLGQRISDVHRLGQQHIGKPERISPRMRAIHPGRWLAFRQHKNRNSKPVDLVIPILPELEQALAAGPVGALTFLETGFGKPHTVKGLGNWFGDMCAGSGVPGRAHGLRKAGATIAAENGATPHHHLIEKVSPEHLPMLRALILSAIAMVAITFTAAADPLLGDDVVVCRERQPNAQAQLDACERVIADGKAGPKDLAVAYAVRGNTFKSKRVHDKAIEAYNKAIELDPDNPGFINERGWIYEITGKDDLALADFNLALRKRPNAPVLYNNRGLIYLRKGALQSALDDFNTAIRLKPDMYYARVNRGRVLAMNRDFDGALADFAEAEKVDPNRPQAAVYRCVAYTDMGRFDDAINDCNNVIAKVPNYAYALCSRAEAYMGKGNLDAALKDLNTVLSWLPNHVRAHMDRGRLFEKRGKLDEARADYRSAAYALQPFDEIDVTMARKIAQERLAALTSKGPGTTTQAARRIALVIGNGAYKNVHALDNPQRDSQLIAASLKGVGFQSVTVANDLTRDKFFETLRAFAREAENSDWAVVYYAGHGFEVGGVNYLVPVDAKLAVDTDAEREAVSLEQVIASVSGAHQLRLLMLDACRNNPFAATMAHTIALKLVDKGFSDIEPSAGFMVVYAAKHGETALDGEGANSPFAVAVARDIKEPRVEVRKLFDIVRDDVWTATRHAQQPFTYGSPPGREDFYFVTGTAAQAPAPTPHSAPAKKK